ncbi:gas vesicle protein [Streptomyces griseoluteus]|uniref:gas vesicle protein GvpO n=1 Tax=Streptomyces griseoluteus TaxID=29306 RepID=UPI0036C2F99C
MKHGSRRGPPPPRGPRRKYGGHTTPPPPPARRGARARRPPSPPRPAPPRAPDSVSALKPTNDGWEADVEVLEVERVPDTTSVMATYRVSLDKEGDLVAYERTRRYTRGQIDRRG